MSVSLKASKREILTKSQNKILRENGQVPGIVYGKEKDPQTISVDEVELIKVIRSEGRNAVLSLDIDSGDKVDVLFHEYQVNPLKGELIHVDFYMADMSQAIDVTVPLRLEGEPKQGILQQPLFELQVRAKPNDIPEEITVDASGLEIGDTITVSNIPVSGDFELLEDPETTVASVLAPDNEVSEEHAEEVEAQESDEE
ncbi:MULTISPECIES: 50S ribosomal protein L25/general stress protein Ctc [Oceanobacillus]|uniref:50S ribosomal protein L25/general stress protein Ctc n=1 Tax=Oceanobacillus TaxID=182709 RepID=UPI0006223989|nr:50S ribosomal protein L25/general stress protein Ctc [Oceanobacillus caeni]KKE77590.1 50S ribosomal protein L25 [Bacilli bacterium VT-13-104]PZD87038.1 50S ribosomal protein L25 [Bacilli bacterium]MED4473383.1 50S ribosomal protein L25/general stress protein Ctc [Oceanobacillus caeni]PZD88483.1 50S ribosomal protein L25 [Bacilli bacterium]PZD91563.1 50S ribosomal protein L25 [Bacilli bacterium]